MALFFFSFLLLLVHVTSLRCVEDGELRGAVGDFLAEGDESDAAATYDGLVIGEWCVDGVSDFSFAAFVFSSGGDWPFRIRSFLSLDGIRSSGPRRHFISLRILLLLDVT